MTKQEPACCGQQYDGSNNCQSCRGRVLLPALVDFDWEEVFKYADRPNRLPAGGLSGSESAFCRGQVRRILALCNGTNEGPAWIGIFELIDGCFAAVEAICDYTGWG